MQATVNYRPPSLRPSEFNKSNGFIGRRLSRKMCTFIYSNLRILKNLLLNWFYRLIRNIESIAAQQLDETGQQHVFPKLVLNRNKILGKGRGTVYEGTWEEAKVAVKRILIVDTDDNAKEDYALRKCHHPNVIRLLGIYSDNIEFKCYVLEFCEASLDQLFLEKTNPNKFCWPFPVTEKEVILQLAKGMEHIHEQGLIHRDIKPENALIRVERNRVLMKWADFGFSKPVNERGSHSISGLKGTDYWYAAEICRLIENEENMENWGRGTVKSDVFSEGLVFAYYLLGGNHPYGKLYDIPKNILNSTQVNLNEIAQHPMYNIIMDMLKNDPVERISSSQVVERISNIE